MATKKSSAVRDTTGASKKDITLTVGRHGGVIIPEQGATAKISYDGEQGLVLPAGQMARE